MPQGNRINFLRECYCTEWTFQHIPDVLLIKLRAKFRLIISYVRGEVDFCRFFNSINTENKYFTKILTKRSTFRPYHTAFFRNQLVTRKYHVIAYPARPAAHGPTCLTAQTVTSSQAESWRRLCDTTESSMVF